MESLLVSALQSELAHASSEGRTGQASWLINKRLIKHLLCGALCEVLHAAYAKPTHPSQLSSSLCSFAASVDPSLCDIHCGNDHLNHWAF